MSCWDTAVGASGQVRRVLAGMAAALLMGAIYVAPAPVAAQDGRERTTASDESDVQRRARIRMELAANYYAQGQMTTALDEVKQALQAVPDLAEGYNLRGLIYAVLGDDKLADESFRRALQLKPQDGDTLHNYGFFNCERRRYAEADDLFNRALAVPGYRSASRSLLLQGVCQARSGNLEQAEKTLVKAYEMDAGNPAIAMNLAEVLYRRGDYERARFYVRRVNNQAELKNVESLWLAARVERKLGNDSGARELGTQLRERYPTSREAAAFERGAFDD
ncbi:type IV pilus biogenesis/stability protein PilW [Rivibacter subsaxonicus]|uniref:Type IV pilus assembly protein PilF n=1 Tax=Rivibacter subsaxonicus TaxID=457575 RepID=A0A4Q7VAZ9_9BURK|nr:type IV pilus biogenesis/stability protein PilW [Rivibacter subsaxonicus]RZT92513.1 type IV pilus assembly protein PilF [Rivibacter subsaxonicus]